MLVAALAVPLLPLVPSGLLSGAKAADQRDYFAVPSAAFSNELGRFPSDAPCYAVPYALGDPRCNPGGVQSPLPAQFGGGDPPVQPGLGVPLGGVGAGSFMINQAGTFGPWNFGGQQDYNFENRILPQAAFHLREQVAGSDPTVRTLASNAGPWGGILPAWNPLQPGDGTYSALWPFGWTTYRPFQTDVSMRFWSPIVAGNDELTSMPVAYFDVRLANHTGRADKVSVMFTMPNAPEHSGSPWEYPLTPVNPPTVRTGLSSSFSTDSTTGISAVTLSASSPQNSTDAQDTDWTIAARPGPGQQVSYTPSWNASGDGGDIYAPFTASGKLPDASLDSSSSAGAIAVSATLNPGETAVIPFALAWDFPTVTPPSGEFGSLFMRRYTSYFGATETGRNDYIAGSYPAHQGLAIANRMLSEHDANLAAVKSWWVKIVDNPVYPDWLVRQALSEDTQMVFHDAFWESGRITSTPSPATRIGAAVPGTHIFCSITGGGYRGCNEWDVDAQGYQAEELLWPSLERDRLLAVNQEQAQDVTGFCCPDTAYNQYKQYRETTGPLQFGDVPMKTIFRDWALYKRTGDTKFLTYVYPVMVKLTKIMQAGIKPGDHFPTDYPGQSSTYDVLEVVGHGIYNSGLWLLTEEIMIEATREAVGLGIPQASSAFQQALESDLPLAKSEFETLFWDPVTNHYKIDMAGSHGNGYFVDAAYAQHVATSLGLPPFMDDQHLVTHMLNAYPQFMQLRDDTGHYIGPPNVAPLVGPIPTAPTFYARPEDDLVWTGSATTMAAAYISEGKRLKNQVLVQMGLEVEHHLEYQLTENIEHGYFLNFPEYWPNFEPRVYAYAGGNRVRAAMAVLNAVSPVPGS